MSQVLKQTLDNVVRLFEKKPEKALFTYEAETESGQDARIKAKAQQFEFYFDPIEVPDEKNSAPTPEEFSLAALGACHSIVFRILALKENVSTDEIRVRLTGHTDRRGFLEKETSTGVGFQSIRFQTTVDSDAPDEKLREIFQKVERLCPVNDIIANPVPITRKIAIRNSKGQSIDISHIN